LFLVDSGVWIDHLREADPDLERALRAGQVLGHPFVTGEIAMGSLKDRKTVIEALQCLPQAEEARGEEVLDLVERQVLSSRGLGWIDAHLIASALLTADARIWTRDRRLHDVAERLGLGGNPAAGQALGRLPGPHPNRPRAAR
jgi:predicted nucleic acid-binding protein